MKNVLVVLIMCLSTVSFAESTPMVNVEGKCSKKDSSNQFDITLNVIAEGVKSADAMASAKTSYSELVKRVKSLDLKKVELTTSNFSVYDEKEVDSKGVVTSKKYRATVSLDVRSEDIEKLPKVLSLAEELGLENVHGLRFSLSESRQKEIKKECYQSAVVDAKEKAEALAAGLGMKISGVLAINESGSVVGIPRPMMMSMKSSSMESDMSVEAGNSTVEVRVQVSFSIAPK